MQRKRIVLGYLLIAGLALSPLLVSLGAGLVTSLLGCRLHEGQALPCRLGGSDIGGTLYTLGMLGWFTLGTIPLGGLLFLIFTGYLFLKRMRAR